MEDEKVFAMSFAEVELIEDPLMQGIRYHDKQVDELAKWSCGIYLRDD